MNIIMEKMSQNVPLKKIQVAERQKQVSDMYLKNMSITKISEMFGVDRKTIQRDLQQVKFNFAKSTPSTEMYVYATVTLGEHALAYNEATKLFCQIKTHREAIEYLKILNKMWETKAKFLAKIGLFDSLPSMVGEKYNLAKDVYSMLPKDKKK